MTNARLIILVLALFAFPVTAATASVPNMTCRAVGNAVTGFVAGRLLVQSDTTEVFRIENGKVYHRWSGREEYFYNTIVEAGYRRYVSGHIVFVIDENGSGYAVIAGQPTEWEAYFLECKP
jgi:hypothetical protein